MAFDQLAHNRVDSDGHCDIICKSLSNKYLLSKKNPLAHCLHNNAAKENRLPFAAILFNLLGGFMRGFDDV
jgi:hypothetical protein